MVAKAEDKIAIISGLSLLTCSALVGYLLITPIYKFRGPITGYVSLSSYSVTYFEEEWRCGVLSSLINVSIALFTVSIICMFISIYAIVSRRRDLSAGLLFGSALSLLVAVGAIRGIINLLDSAVKPLTKIQQKISTTAGLIEFPDLLVERSWAYEIISSPMIFFIVAVPIVFSTIYLVMSGSKIKEIVSKSRLLVAILLLASSIFAPAHASVHAYMPVNVSVVPVHPTAVFAEPEYVCSLFRSSRSALVFTDFETIPPGWTSRGGVWSIVSGGYKGNAMRGDDNNAGIGTSSQYYWNRRLDTLYSSLWVSVKVYGSPIGTYKGLSLINSALNRLYEASIYSSNIEVWSYNVEALGWVRLGSAPITGFTSGQWYTIVLRYSVEPTRLMFYVWVYNQVGSQVAYLEASSTSPNRFTPAYIGLEVDGTYALFEDFIMSTTDPRNLSFSGLRVNMQVEVWDNLGYIVASRTATGPSLDISIAHDIVVGTGVDGRIVVKRPDGSICIDHRVPTSDAILGGDSYAVVVLPSSIVLGPNRVSAYVYATIFGSSAMPVSFQALKVIAYQTFYARLLLAGYEISGVLTLDITITGVSESTPIRVANNVVQSDRTSEVRLLISDLNRIDVKGSYFEAAGQSARLYIFLEICTLSSQGGACAHYPITLELVGLPYTGGTGMSVTEIGTQEGNTGVETPNREQRETHSEDGEDRVVDGDERFPIQSIIERIEH